MGRKKTKKEPIVITRESLLYQPLSLAVSGYEATAMQQNIVIALLRKLKECFKAVRDNQFSPAPKQLTLFSDDKAVAQYSSQGEFRFDIHMSEIGVQPKHYPVAFDMLYKASDVIVYVPDPDGDGKKMRRTKFFDTSDENVTKVMGSDGRVTYKYKNRSPVTTIIMSKPVVDFLFQTDSRIYDFIDDTAMMISEKFPKRIYLYLSTKKSLQTFKIDYWRFRHDIGINDADAPIDPVTKERQIMHPYFSYFVRDVLNPAKKKLKKLCEENRCDFYFDFTPVYKNGKRAKNPDELEFTIFLSDLGNSIQSDKNVIRENIELERLMLTELKQTKVQVNALLKRMKPELRGLFIDKVNKLISAKQSNTKIKDVRAWANRSLTLFLDELEAADVQQPALDFSEERVGEEQRNAASSEPAVMEAVPLPSELQAKWEVFLSCIRGLVSEEDYRIWFAPIGLQSYEDGLVTIEVPTAFVAQFIHEHFAEAMRQAIGQAFGDGASFRYGLKNNV